MGFANYQAFLIQAPKILLGQPDFDYGYQSICFKEEKDEDIKLFHSEWWIKVEIGKLLLMSCCPCFGKWNFIGTHPCPFA